MCCRDRGWQSVLRLLVVPLLWCVSIGGLWSQSVARAGHGYGYASVYDGVYDRHGRVYDWMWGEHYRALYYMRVGAPRVDLSEWLDGMHVVQSMPDLHGLLLSDSARRYYLLKMLGSTSSFVESSFFRQIYNRRAYRNTYLGNFIREASTIENPFGFLISDNLARKIGLNTGNIRLVELVANSTDSILSDLSVDHRLASIYRLPDLDSVRIETNSDVLLQSIHQGKSGLDVSLYLRTRLFDMLIGDWNKIPENWGWELVAADTLGLYKPMVLDRSHAFTKVDGVFFKRLLAMLGLGFITNYDAKAPNVRKVNELGYALDMALTANCDERDWVEQARYIERVLTDSVLNEVYELLPVELRNNVFKSIVNDIRARRQTLRSTASDYYHLLQKTPILVAYNSVVDVENGEGTNLHVRLLDKLSHDTIVDKVFDGGSTHSVWLYLMGDSNRVRVDKRSKKISLSLISPGHAHNVYSVDAAANTRLYATRSESQRVDSLRMLKTVQTNDPALLRYDYEKYPYSKLSFTPIGVYDSDLGLNIGTSMSYTLFGVRRRPFTSQHQLSYNYTSGLTYQGIFPIFNSKSSFHLLAFASNKKSFYNFFGMGNNTDSFSDEGKNYNRVHYEKYLIMPSFNHQIDSSQEFITAISFEYFKLRNSSDRYINRVFGSGNDIFKHQYYVNLSATYSFEKKMSDVLSNVSVVLNPGWIVDLRGFENNVPYVSLDVGADLRLSSRLTLVTLLSGKSLFSNNYRFYQAATTDLRGFRSNRFIGKQSFYECTDLRLDMGRLQNPFTPLGYGLFVGADHGRVWYPQEDSKKWHASFGGGFWLTVFKQFTGKFSYFASKDHEKRFLFELGLSF